MNSMNKFKQGKRDSDFFHMEIVTDIKDFMH